MEWTTLAILATLIGTTMLHWRERQSWAKERRDLVAAALAPVNPAGSSLVRTPTVRTEQVKRPMPIDL